jgi:microcystin-dependent protein
MPAPPPLPSTVPKTVYVNNNLYNYQMASQNPSSVPTVLPNALPPLNNAINNSTPQWLPYNGGAGTGVSAIVAGSGISITPPSGVGSVTVATVAASPYTVGMIMMWNSLVGIPTGWAPCDGSIVNGYTTPNLTNRFVVQAGGSGTAYPTIGLTGGNGSTVLTLNMIPDHTHSGVIQDTASGTATAGQSFAALGNTGGISNGGYTPGTPVPTIPPYYSLLHIIYVGVAP